MIKTIGDIKNMEIDCQLDWKFGLITRTVRRIEETLFVIDDTSHRWVQAEVTLEQFEKLFSGELSITGFDWK